MPPPMPPPMSPSSHPWLLLAVGAGRVNLGSLLMMSQLRPRVIALSGPPMPMPRAQTPTPTTTKAGGSAFAGPFTERRGGALLLLGRPPRLQQLHLPLPLPLGLVQQNGGNDDRWNLGRVAVAAAAGEEYFSDPHTPVLFPWALHQHGRLGGGPRPRQGNGRARSWSSRGVVTTTAVSLQRKAGAAAYGDYDKGGYYYGNDKPRPGPRGRGRPRSETAPRRVPRPPRYDETAVARQVFADPYFYDGDAGLAQLCRSYREAAFGETMTVGQVFKEYCTSAGKKKGGLLRLFRETNANDLRLQAYFNGAPYSWEGLLELEEEVVPLLDPSEEVE